jgi:DNA-binding transcriptional LysR family regulator
MGVSPSALSQTIKGLEGRPGVRLLTRTTRSVAPTEAGERLLQTVAPRFEKIEQALVALVACVSGRGRSASPLASMPLARCCNRA